MKASELVAQLQALIAEHGDGLIVVDNGNEDWENLQDDAWLRSFKGWYHGEYQGWKDYPPPEDDSDGPSALCIHVH